MKLTLLCLLLAACRNDAITYAHSIDPSAECHAVHTTPDGDMDTATCRMPAFKTQVFCISTRGFLGCLENDHVFHSVER